MKRRLAKQGKQLNWKDYEGDILFGTLGADGGTANLSAFIIPGTAYNQRLGNKITVHRIELFGFVQGSQYSVLSTCRLALVQGLATDTIATPLKFDDVFYTTPQPYPPEPGGSVDGMRRITFADNLRLLWDSGPIAVVGSTGASNTTALLTEGQSTSEQDAYTIQQDGTNALTFTTTASGASTGTITNLVPFTAAVAPTTLIQNPGTNDFTTSFTQASSTSTNSGGQLRVVPSDIVTTHTFSLTGGIANTATTTTTKQFFRTVMDCKLSTTYSVDSAQLWPLTGSIYLLSQSDCSNDSGYQIAPTAHFTARLWYTNDNQK